jgi:peroxiredoxin Q/BCP
MEKIFLALLVVTSSIFLQAAELKINEAAPSFKAFNQENVEFDLSSRKGKWTVLYFYPKAGTPGCTKQACAFRDSISKIRALTAEVYGISSDSVADQAAFYKKHHLNFDLLADPESKVINMFGSKMPMLSMSKRWTFIIDPELKIKDIMKDVDPVIDSERVAKVLTDLQKK